MKISIRTVESFITWLEQERPDLVLVDSDTEEINEGGQKVYLRAGFLKTSLHELLEHCGEDWRPLTEGTEEAKNRFNVLAAACQKLGIELREGSYSE